MMNMRVTLANVYGPSSGDNPAFFDKVTQKIEEVGSECTIFWGSWNVVLDVNVDYKCYYSNYKTFVNRPRARKEIEELIIKLDLVDPWRELYPDKRIYTWIKFNSTKQGRLDYFLVSQELLTRIKGAKIESSYMSDHSLISVEFKIDTVPTAKSFWKLNNSLLRAI